MRLLENNFQARAGGPRHHQRENILLNVQRALDDIRCVIDKNEFDELHDMKEGICSWP